MKTIAQRRSPREPLIGILDVRLFLLSFIGRVLHPSKGLSIHKVIEVPVRAEKKRAALPWFTEISNNPRLPIRTSGFPGFTLS
jgi:hypothetical protein